MSTARSVHSLTRQQLYRLVWQSPLTNVAEELGMSANGLAKVCDRVAVPYPSRGYWARERAGKHSARPELPPYDGPARITISGERSKSRRTRSRLSPEERREQLLEAARTMIAAEGLHGTTMKRIAAAVGVSEAQAHNYFTRDEIFIEIARRELEAMERGRQADIERGNDSQTRAMLGTLRYLREVENRGALIQTLLASPAVRDGLRRERGAKSQAGTERLTNRFNREYGVPTDISRVSSRILTAVSLRTGRLLANRKISLPTAERLLIPMIVESNRQMIAKWGESPRDGELAPRPKPRQAR